MKSIHLLTPRRLMVALIALPFALYAVYLFGFANTRYVSEAVVTVRQASQEQASLPGIAMLLGGVNPPSREDTLYLKQYIQSLGLMKQLDAKLDLRAHYSQPMRDALYRLDPQADQESFLDYYRARVEVVFDDVTSLLTVRTQGFDAAFAHQLNVAILAECERFVNAFSQRMATEQMAFSQVELDRATKRLESARDAVLDFQTRHKLIDPMAEAQAAGTLAASLQAELSRQESELRNLQSYLNESAYPVRAMRNQIAATRAQLDSERLRATATGRSGDKLNALAAEYEALRLRATFAEDAYKLTLTSLENARIEAARKLKSLVVVEPPTLPETALYPRRVYDLVTLLIIATFLYGIVRLVVATIRDHID